MIPNIVDNLLFLLFCLISHTYSRFFGLSTAHHLASPKFKVGFKTIWIIFSCRNLPRLDEPDWAEDVSALRSAVDGSWKKSDFIDGALRDHLAARRSCSDGNRTAYALGYLVKFAYLFVSSSYTNRFDPFYHILVVTGEIVWRGSNKEPVKSVVNS